MIMQGPVQGLPFVKNLYHQSDGILEHEQAELQSPVLLEGC